MITTECAVATGENFPDALAGAAMIGAKGGILILVNSADSAAVSQLESANGKINICYFFGGTAAVSDEVADGIVEKLSLSWKSE